MNGEKYDVEKFIARQINETQFLLTDSLYLELPRLLQVVEFKYSEQSSTLS